jgi:hypothetical protein
MKKEFKPLLCHSAPDAESGVWIPVFTGMTGRAGMTILLSVLDFKHLNFKFVHPVKYVFLTKSCPV